MMRCPVRYYQQFDADYSLEAPGAGYGGWSTTVRDFDEDTLALVVVHANDPGSFDAYPGWYRAVEYIPRSLSIMEDKFPTLLGGARNANVPVVHLAGTPGFHKSYDGYHRACESLNRYEAVSPDAARETPRETPRIPENDELRRHREFRAKAAFPGAHNTPDIERGRRDMTGFPVWSKPVGDEYVVDTADMLDAACRDLGKTHLIYCGFAVNWCIFMSGGGMVDMSRRGYLCSIIDDATTAVENRESAAEEGHKEYGLWTVSLAFGFVFSSDDLLHGFSESTKSTE